MNDGLAVSYHLHQTGVREVKEEREEKKYMYLK